MPSATTTREVADLGLIGLGVMGENLALNFEDHGYRVALWTHTEAKVQRFIESGNATRRFVGTQTLEEFVAALDPPAPHPAHGQSGQARGRDVRAAGAVALAR